MIDKFVCLDVEMPNGDGNRISAIGITVFENGEVTKRIYSLIDPETWFQPYVVELIGITPEMVDGKPNFAEYWNEIKNVLSDGLLVGHGAGNDLKALSCCLKYYKIDWQPEINYLCTVEACSKLYPDRHAYSLNTLCEEFGIELDHHNALSDSEACGRLLLRCIKDGLDVEKMIKTFDLLEGHGKSNKQPITVKLEIVNKARNSVREDLFFMSSQKCKRNFLKNYPDFSQDKIIGVCQAVLYTYYKKNSTSEKLNFFTKLLPHDYHEENNLHAIIISNSKKYSQAIKQIDDFLPFVDNAETCSLLRPKVFIKKQDSLSYKFREWISSGEKYTVIFGLNSLTCYYIMTKHLITFLEAVATIKRDDPEIEAAVKRFYAEALAKAPKRVIRFILKGKIDDILEDVTALALNKEGLKPANRERIELFLSQGKVPENTIEEDKAETVTV